MDKKQKELILKTIFWAPRVLAILFILSISIFALDVFGEGYGLAETLIALFMHLIPSILLIVILSTAWRWEKIGGIIFLTICLIFTIFFDTYERIVGFLILTCPLLLIGGLFLAAPYLKKRFK